MDLPQTILQKMEATIESNTKRNTLDDLFDALLNLPDNQGLGPINRMLQKLSTWSNFTSSDDPQKAEKAVGALADLIQASSQKRDTFRREKENREQELAKQQLTHTRLTQQDQLKKRYFDLINSTNPQQRGLEFERELLQDIFQFEAIKSTDPFVLKGEQIDGAIEFDTEHYIVESKWTKTKTSPEEVSWFKTKIERKLTGTRGVMISVIGFTDEAVRTATESRCIILMDGDDLYHVLEISIELTFRELLQRKIAEFARKGNSFIKARQIINEK